MFMPSCRVCVLEVSLLWAGCILVILVNSFCLWRDYILFAHKYELRFWVTAQLHFASERV